MPMQPDDEMMEAPEAPDAEMQEGEVDDGSYCIELTVHPDGTFTVESESAADEAAEGGESGEAGETGGQTYSNLKEAMTAILDIVKGGDREPSVIPKATERSQMSAGYNEGKSL